jgi:acyl-CoA thioester hydrolase
MTVTEHHDAVQPDWLDSNGHMNLAYYVVVFDRGTDVWLDHAGFAGAYREAGNTVFAVETHTLYRQELRLGAPMTVRSWLIAADSKRLHLAHEMTSDGVLAAMQEVLFVHVSLDTRRVVAMGPAALAPMLWVGRPRRTGWVGGLGCRYRLLNIVVANRTHPSGSCPCRPDPICVRRSSWFCSAYPCSWSPRPASGL